MILPNRHIRLAESLFGLGAFLLAKIDKPQTIDELWNDLEKAMKSGKFPFAHSFENLILAIDLLHILGAIELDNQGRVVLCNY